MLRKRDLILILALAALAGGSLLFLPQLRTPADPTGGLYLLYRMDGGEPSIIALTEERDLTIDQGGGQVNTLRLWPQGFVMASSTCHNQLCVYQGPVTLENREERPLLNMVVCAPHRLVAELLTAQELEDAGHAQ